MGLVVLLRHPLRLFLPALDVLHDLALGHSFVAMCCSSLYCMTAGFFRRTARHSDVYATLYLFEVPGSGDMKNRPIPFGENRTIFLLR